MQLLSEDGRTKAGVGKEIIQGHKNYHAGAEQRCISFEPPSDTSYKKCFKERHNSANYIAPVRSHHGL